MKEKEKEVREKIDKHRLYECQIPLVKVSTPFFSVIEQLSCALCINQSLFLVPDARVKAAVIKSLVSIDFIVQ